MGMMQGLVGRVSSNYNIKGKNIQGKEQLNMK